MGNGLLTFVDEKVEMNNFFNTDEMIFYSNINDLADKIKFYSKNDLIRKKIAKKGKKKYFKLFNEKRIAEYFINISIGKEYKLF
jgi:spore maturation protein CgeB